MKNWVSEILTSEKRLVMPVMTYPGLELINKNIMDVITNGENQAECIEALARKYPSAAAVTIMDLSVESEAFGSPVRFTDHEVPAVTTPIVSDEETAEALKVPKVGAGRTNVYISAAELVASHVEDRPTFGGAIGPFSLAGRLVDMTEIMIQAMLEPDMVHIVLGKCTEFLIDYIGAIKAVGANGIILAEPAAGLLSPEMCQSFSSDYVKRIVDAVQDENFIVILHNCGNTVKLVSSMVSTGAMGLHFGNAVDMADIMPQVPAHIIAFGNIDPARTFKNGTVDEMKTLTMQLLEKTASYKNFVLSSGCDVPPETSLDNVDAFYDTLEVFNGRVL